MPERRGGKYLERKQVANPKTGKMKWVYKYKPVSQRGAHEVTGKTFQKKTGGSGEEHKNAVEKALQSGNRVSLHVLRDYPDLVQKYGFTERLKRAKKISNKVMEIRKQINQDQKSSENGNMEKPELPEKHYDDLLDYDQNVEFGDTQSENEFISKLAEMAEKYDVSEFIKHSSGNGLLSDDAVMERFQKKLKQKS